MQAKSEHSYTSNDNTFNFNCELDISNTKKQKTGDMFFKQNFDFEDFANIGGGGDDKTIKSSSNQKGFGRTKQYSAILKPSVYEPSNNGTYIADNDAELNGQFDHPVLSASMRKVYYQNQMIPKFAETSQNPIDRENSFLGSQASNSKSDMRKTTEKKFILDPLRNSDTGKINPKFSGSNLNGNMSKLQQQDVQVNNRGEQRNLNIKLNPIQYQPTFKKKAVDFEMISQAYNDNLHANQSEFKEVSSMINFYRTQTQKIQFQRSILQEQSIPSLIEMSNEITNGDQLKRALNQTNILNSEIQKQRSFEKKLTRVIAELEDEYNQILESVNQMNFRRPAVIKDQAKAIIEEINTLKSQFQSIHRQDEQLNLSASIQPTSFQNRYGGSGSPQSFKHNNSNKNKQQYANDQLDQHNRKIKQQNLLKQKNQQDKINELFEEIYQANTKSQDTDFLKNLKFSCFKQQWTIYQDKQIQISVSYRGFPAVQLKIGNKSNQLLRNLSIEAGKQQYKTKIIQNSTMNKKSFISERLVISEEVLKEIFIPVVVKYQRENTQQRQYHKNQPSQQTPITENVQQINIFVSTGILNLGEFVPLSIKEFQSQMQLNLSSIESGLKPLDKNFISNIKESTFYFPNLKFYPQDPHTVFGLFMSLHNQGSLVIMQEHLDLVKIKIKNGNQSLLRLLEFLVSA